MTTSPKRLVNSPNLGSLFGVISIIVVAALLRLLPHPPNFTPIIAMALLGGARLPERRLAIAIVFASMMLSDLFLGFHSTMFFVYPALAIIVLMGEQLKNSERALPIFLTTCLAAVFFFFVSNFGVWALQTLYPKTLAGLLACYLAALPFFKNLILGDLFYTVLLFGAVLMFARVPHTVSRTSPV